MNTEKETEENLEFAFGDNFLKHHAGQIITDQRFAIIELVANSWDAGAAKVEIKWPINSDRIFEIKDNGIGMTYNEFRQRWCTLNYNRLDEQGREVTFPNNVKKNRRMAFGRNGIGRHAMFCFSDTYEIITQKDGELTHAKVTLESGSKPFDIKFFEREETSGNGTTIKTLVKDIKLIEEQKVMELIGSSFIADPEFKIYVNDKEVHFMNLEHLSKTFIVKIDGIGDIVIKRFETEKGRTIKHNGVAWWVNNRLVGQPEWKGVEGRLIDGRNPIAKQYTYIIISDILTDQVRPDWSGFYSNENVVIVHKKVYDYIAEDLSNLMYESRRERKKEVLYANRETLKGLSDISKHDVSHFIDELQLKCPTFGVTELEATVEVLAKFEKARSGYALLEKLAKLDVNDIDSLNMLLDEWSIEDAKKVLNELRYRLDLIKKLDELVDNHTTDELHDLQPLFERGLWIFGPEFESISYISNRSLSTIVKKFLQDKGKPVLENPSKRPDFVVLPDTSIGIYASDRFDENHQVDGFSQIIIVELKKGGFKISLDEKSQALNYARELRRSGKIDQETKIICYVLGSSIAAEDNVKMTDGQTEIIPRRYNSILRQANARTFNLLQKLENTDKVKEYSEQATKELLEVYPDNYGDGKLFVEN